jgi:hypothetical protein
VEKDAHNAEVGERLRAEEDYQNWLRVKKMQKNDQVKEYRQILETQMQLSVVKQETDRRSSLGSNGGGSPGLGARRMDPDNAKTAPPRGLGMLNGPSPRMNSDQLDP